MKLKIKLALYVPSAGAIAFGGGACLFRWLGDAVGDALVSAVID